MKIYRCKLHDYSHDYTVCPSCGCQYCPEHWAVCPRTSWHPSHATTAEGAGARFASAETAYGRTVAYPFSLKVF